MNSLLGKVNIIGRDKELFVAEVKRNPKCKEKLKAYLEFVIACHKAIRKMAQPHNIYHKVKIIS